MRPLLPSVALVTAVFLLGCEEGSSPVQAVDLEPQFGKPGACSAVPPHPSCKDGDGDGGGNSTDLITAGRTLFFEETFGGNGRTCGTCHRADNNLTIDVEFIDDLPGTDLLFIAEFTAAQQFALGVNLPAFDPTNSSAPAFEDPVLMRARGLILANIQGFDVDGGGDLINPPVFRAPPSLFNLSVTAPYGLSGNIPDLREFSTGAVIQHFPKTLNRTAEGPNPDFVLPTESQLDALEAFMLSLQSPMDGNFKVSGPNSILSIPGDRRALDTNRADVRGRNLFSFVGCTSCHSRSQTALSGGNRATGVEDLPINAGLPTRDIGAGTVADPSFQTPGVFGLRKTAFFHNNAVGNNTTPLPGKTLQFTNLRDAVAFYVSAEFKASPTGGQVGPMTEAEIQDIAAYLVAISAL